MEFWGAYFTTCEDPLQRPKPNPEAWQISRLPLFAFCMRSAFFWLPFSLQPSIGLWLLACLLASFCCQCCCWRAAGRTLKAPRKIITLLLVRDMCGDGVVAASPSCGKHMYSQDLLSLKCRLYSPCRFVITWR